MGEILASSDRKQKQLKKSVSPQSTVLTYPPAHCLGSEEDFEDIMIEYVALVEERLVVIRDVPALLCRASGKKYILEETLDKVEHLLALEKEAKVQPNEILEIPVFSLKTTVL